MRKLHWENFTFPRTLPRNCDHGGVGVGHGYIKEELELEPGNGSASAVTGLPSKISDVEKKMKKEFS